MKEQRRVLDWLVSYDILVNNFLSSLTLHDTIRYRKENGIGFENVHHAPCMVNDALLTRALTISGKYATDSV